MPAVSITSFRWRGSITWTITSTSNSPAPRRRRAGRPTDDNSQLTSVAPRLPRPWGDFCRPKQRRDRPPPKRDGAASERALDRLVEPFVVERATHGRELVAKFFGRRRRDVGVVGALVLPDGNHREVVRPVALLEHVEAHGTWLLAAVRHQGLERCNTLVLLRRRNVDMRHHDDRPARNFFCRRSCDLHARVHPIVDRADEIWLDLLAKFLAVRGGLMRVVGL